MYEIYRAGESKSTGETSLKPSQDPQTTASQSSASTDPVSPQEPKACRNIDDYSETMRHEYPTSHLLTAFAPKPTNVSFDSQSETERVVLLLRQHPVVLTKPILIFIAGLIFPTVLSFTPFLNFLPDKFHLGFLFGWYVMLSGFALQTFLVWFFNVYIVTDERIIDVDFLSIVYKNVSSAKIDNIEDVTVTTSGASESIFDYGSVLVQTAAEKSEFEFENVPHPTKVAAIINDIMIEEEREKIEGRVS